MPNLTLSHRATTIHYTPSTYAFDNATTGWLSTSTGHSTLSPNASFQIEWTGKGIHVDGVATGNGTLLLSLDGGAFTQVNTNQSGLVDYHSLPFGNHNLAVRNVPGGNLTFTGYSLLDLGSNGETVTQREISSTVQNATGGWIQNPEFSWDGDWAIRSSNNDAAPIMNTKPKSLTSFSFNISDCTLVEIYGVGTTYSVNYHWDGTSPSLIRRLSRRSVTSSEIVRRDQATHFPGEKLMWKKNLDRTLTYVVEVDVIPNGGQWAMSRVVVTDSVSSSLSKSNKIIIGVTVSLGLLLVAILFCARRKYVRRKLQRQHTQTGNRQNFVVLSSFPSKHDAPPSYSAVPLTSNDSEDDVTLQTPRLPHI